MGPAAVTYSGAKLGTVTHLANNHEIKVMEDGGKEVTKRLRDSAAESRD